MTAAHVHSIATAALKVKQHTCTAVRRCETGKQPRNNILLLMGTIFARMRGSVDRMITGHLLTPSSDAKQESRRYIYKARLWEWGSHPLVLPAAPLAPM